MISHSFVNFYSLFFIGSFVCSIKINRLTVPEIVRSGSPVELDCDFTLEEFDQDLVVKWFLNQTLVYQWIPGSRTAPISLGVLKNLLNVEASSESRHRTLYISRAEPKLSGEYTCKVSTLASDDQMSKTMLVFEPEKNLTLDITKTSKGFMEIKCSASGIYPQPSISLHSQQREISGSNVVLHQLEELYNISIIVRLPTLMIPEDIYCKLNIPQVNYTSRRIIRYTATNDVSTNTLNYTIQILTNILVITKIYFIFTGTSNML